VTLGPSDKVSSERGSVRRFVKRTAQLAWLLTWLSFIVVLLHSRDRDPLRIPAAIAWGLCGLFAIALSAVDWLLTRMRLTVRWMMVAIAIGATLLGVCIELTRRRARFLEIAEAHAGYAGLEGTLVITDQGPAYVGLRTEQGRWHELMRRKYEYHARHPWLPVPIDPSEPE
jgi:hypothetical protein